MRLLRSWPLTFFGLLTIGVVILAEVVQRSGTTTDPLYGVLRVIIVPIWLMRYVVVAIGGLLLGSSQATGLPVWYDILTVPVLLLPYMAADLALIRTWRWLQSWRAHAT